MLYYLTAAGIIAHTYFWGGGLAWLVLPRIWRQWVWVFAPGFGFALQSALVWAGVHTALAGTDSYAWWSELVPSALLAIAFSRRTGGISRKYVGLLIVALLAGWRLLSPMTELGIGLTTSSLGNCDQADYAAGARVFQEFSRDDRTGFLGLPEVTKVRSSDYFFDFWVRLNHFTPSALIAHNASFFGEPAFRLVSVMAAVVALLNLPICLFLARLTVGLRGGWLLGFVTLYAVSPLNAYAVYHGQLGQLFAAQGIALLTVGIFGAGRAAHAGRNAWSWWPLTVVSLWLLAGSYNFILPICLVPAIAWIGAEFWQRRDWRAVGSVLQVIVTALGVCALVFWGRFDGLAERYSLFRQYSFGWVVPLFSPEGLVGMFRDSTLSAWPMLGRTALSLLVTGAWIAGLMLLWRRQKQRAVAAFALIVPVMAGWCILAWETQTRANASYDAYKLISVFYPGLLAGVVCWMAAAHGRSLFIQIGAAGLLCFLLAANLWVDGKFRQQMSDPPLRVGRNIAELSSLEKDPEIHSLNMLMDNSWSRLWANAFLLRKPQYFSAHTYEGRMNTALKGEWNLSDSLLRALPFHREDFKQFNSRYHLVRANAEGLVQLNFGSGWYAEEKSGTKRWQWSDGHAQIVVVNATGSPVQARMRLVAQSLQPSDLMVKIGGQTPVIRPMNGSNQTLEYDNFILSPGSTTVAFVSEATSPGGRDDRRLAFALYDLEMQTQPMEK